MTYDVTSAFVDQTLLQTSEPVRRFTIGSSDYSDRVLKWPSMAREWDNPKPVTVTMDLSNADKGMNFLRVDKTLLTSQCAVDMGFISAWDYAWNIDYWESPGVYDEVPISMAQGTPFLRSLRFSKNEEHAYYIETNLGYIHHYDVASAGDFRSATPSSDWFNVFSGMNTTGIYGIDINNDGTKMLVSKPNRVHVFAMSPAYSVQSMTHVNTGPDLTSDDGGFEDIKLSDNGLSLYMLAASTNKNIHLYDMSSDSAVLTMTHNSEFYANQIMSAIDVNPDRSKIYGLDYLEETLYEWNVVSGDITNAVKNQTTFHVSSETTEDPYYLGMSFSRDGRVLNVLDHDYVEAHVLDINNIPSSGTPEYITLFAGALDTVSYKKGKCILRVIDKVKQLSERLVGEREIPVTYTDELLSDVAWWLVTSYGGFDVTKSTANTDIDYTQFNEWSSIMSGDSINVSANFEGIKVTECLRKIARMSHSAIYIENDKLVFSRFSVTADPELSIDESTIIDSTLYIKDADIVNAQYVNAGYNVSSETFTIAVSDVISSSVNSYGLRERVEEDKSIWYVTSTSALNLAQRITFVEGEPQDRITVTTPLTTLTQQIGDTIAYSNDQQAVSENYKIMRRKVDVNKGRVTLNIDRSQLVNPFILDVTSLDGTEVLT